MICVANGENEQNVLVISEKGYGKKTPVDEYRVTNRGGKGVKTINITEKTGNLVGILDVKGTEDLIITCKSGITLRTAVNTIKEAGRATQGVILIRLDESDAIAAISKVMKEEEHEAPAEETAQGTDENGSSALNNNENNQSTDGGVPSPENQ